ncbi:MAG: response regulator transcription factor [Desulfobacteraceae bacterium]|nr:hypothetical protein [Desulfobacteraceae bacterium]MBC2756133.1 response regulator transcription factor [Desulfobacteraceae bacterium]
MTAILILDNQAHRREHLSLELEKEGYCPTLISDGGLDLAHFDCTQFDLAILNLYPDSIKTWELYYDFRKYFPDFPVLVYLIKNIYALQSLKTAIKDILNNHPNSKLSQKGVNPDINAYTNQSKSISI